MHFLLTDMVAENDLRFRGPGSLVMDYRVANGREEQVAFVGCFTEAAFWSPLKTTASRSCFLFLQTLCLAQHLFTALSLHEMAVIYLKGIIKVIHLQSACFTGKRSTVPSVACPVSQS